MKFIKSFFLLIFLFFSYGESGAQEYGTITNFEILPEYLFNGKVRVALGTSVTPVKFKVTIVRQMESSYPTVTWKPVDITIGLSSYGSSGNTPNFISGTKRILSSDFPVANSAFLTDLVVSININNSYLYNGNILLGYRTPNVSSLQSFNYKEYGFERFNGGIPLSLQPYAKEYGPLSNIPMTFIYPNDTTPALTVGSSLYSPNQQYRLTLQTDGNLVLYKRINATSEQALWASDQNTPIKAKTLFFQTDGNLVLYLGNSLNTGFAWASDLSASEGLNRLNSQNSAYALQDDGNFVFYWLHPQGNGLVKWVFGSTNTAGGVVSPNFRRIVQAN